MGYIMIPPFSKMESSFHESVEAVSAAKASPGNPSKLNNPILITRFMMTAVFFEEVPHLKEWAL
jgi:hypothetical protein